MIPVKSKYLHFDRYEDTGRVPIVKEKILDWLVEYQASVKIVGTIYWHGTAIPVSICPFEFHEHHFGDISNECFVFDDPEKEMLFKLTWA